VGGTDYVTKPFLFEEVLARVRTHIALRRARAALAERDARVRELEALLFTRGLK
jgi:DNA-binding response OmpR family regulator